MRSVNLFQVDTFTDSIFGGNPAGVILTEVWLTENQMQLIANENNLAETAFIIPKKEDYRIRWFTPEIEVQLCGHATLAAGFVLKKMYSVSKDPIVEGGPRSIFASFLFASVIFNFFCLFSRKCTP